MRLLHLRAIDERQSVARSQSTSERRRSPPRHDRQYLPLLQLQPIRGIGARGIRRRRAREDGMNALNTVGHPASRIDALQRVTGKAVYTYDVHLDGMLYARVLRSPH